MKDKKNIDNLFSESFKNFEASPSSHVWENIQSELRKEKDNRKVIPLWLKYGGIAALLALLITAGNWVFNPTDSKQNSIGNEIIVKPESVKHKDQNILKKESLELHVATEDKNPQIESTKPDHKTDDNAPKNKKSQSVFKSNPTKIVSTEVTEKDSKPNTNQNENSNQWNNPTSRSGKKIAVSKTTSDLSHNKNEKTKEISRNQDKIKDGSVIDQNIENRISTTKTDNKEEIAVNPEISEPSKNTKSILDAIAENKETDTDILKEEKPQPQHRWLITPNVAPVYYSSFGNGSSIDPDFSGNPQKGEVNMSYGLQVSYSLNNRLSVRSGLNSVDLGYSTSDILIGTGPVAMALGTVDYGGKQIVVTALTRETLNAGNQPNDFGEINLKSSGGDARLIQNINYYEIPLELKYAVTTNKLGINLIGGMSTLILGNNEIAVESKNFSSVLGEANNLSTVSFSTNVGLGLDYKFSRRFVFNVEPMFKYQLNPYTDSSSFKPYYLGVYSGFSFKF